MMRILQMSQRDYLDRGLIKLYEKCYTPSGFPYLFRLGFNADIACSGQVLSRTLVLSMICTINQEC